MATANQDFITMKGIYKSFPGVQALENGYYAVALQQFQFVLEHDPSFPGAQEKYTEALFQLNLSMTPTQVFTPTSSPTSTTKVRSAESC